MVQVFILLVSTISFAFNQPQPVPQPQETSALINLTPQTVQAADLYYEPRKLSIDKINLDVPVISVGKDKNGLQEVPADNGTVSWWKFGARPGEKGSAVLAGHYKIEDGSPGVFYRLNEVKIGDKISITDENGAKQEFEVVNTEIYSVADFPTKNIYADKSGESLNLVTCTGEFLPEKNDYSHRFVVYAKKAS